MSPGAGEPLRVALVLHSYGLPCADGAERQVHELASALREAGHHPHVLSAHRSSKRWSIEDGIPVLRSRQPPDGLLKRRGFTHPLTQVPATTHALVRGGYHVSHAFSPPDALAALLWSRLVRGPVIFGAAEPPRRERLADGRLRLRLVRGAIEGSDAVVAPSEESRLGLLRWLAVDAPHIEPQDALAHEQLYRGLMLRRAQSP